MIQQKKKLPLEVENTSEQIEKISNTINLSSNLLFMDIKDLIPYSKNPRNISTIAIDKVANSIKEFGFINPIIIDKNNVIIAGHTRLKACYKLGLKKVPVIKAENLTPNQVKAYRIADNRTSEETEWNKDLLAIEINDLKLFEDSDDIIDVILTGLNIKELETLNNLNILNNNVGDDVLESNYSHIIDTNEVREPITKTGDLWQLGKHRLLCGDMRNVDNVKRLMNNNLADMIFTDPPYNVKINDIIGSGKVHHDEFVMASGEMNESEFIEFLTIAFENYKLISKDGSIHYICMDWKHIYEILIAERNTYNNYKQLCVWNKDNAGMGSFYRSKHELIFVFKNGNKPNTNNFELGQYGRNRTNVWDYPSVNSFAGRELVTDENGKKISGSSKELEMHPTVKPLKMVIDAILDCSNENELVVDFFLGSGTTLIASEKTNRVCYGMEISLKYCDVIIKRFEIETGIKAKLINNGK